MYHLRLFQVTKFDSECEERWKIRPLVICSHSKLFVMIVFPDSLQTAWRKCKRLKSFTGSLRDRSCF